ncbi:hypothetical protein V6Z11_A05G214400 [Gossypium hirsutum]
MVKNKQTHSMDQKRAHYFYMLAVSHHDCLEFQSWGVYLFIS